MFTILKPSPPELTLVNKPVPACCKQFSRRFRKEASMTTATLEVRVTSARPVNYELYKQFVFFIVHYLIICTSAKAK